jgi:protocatechuate 3,4-dioxygenase beta subunit
MKSLYKISSIAAIIAFVAAFSFSTSFAQDSSNYTSSSKQLTLSGKVVSSQGQAVANAKVMVMKANESGNMSQSDTTDTSQTGYNNSGMNSNSSMTATTDQDGKFTVKNIPSGTYTLKVKADGYQTWKQQVTITKNASRTIKLQKSSQ